MAVMTTQDHVNRYVSIRRTLKEDERSLSAVQSRVDNLRNELTMEATELGKTVGSNILRKLYRTDTGYTVMVSHGLGIVVFDSTGEEVH